MLKNLLYAILLGVGMAACLADRDNTATGPDTDDQFTESTEDTASPAPDPAAFVIAKGQVGYVQVGMPIEEMRQQVQHLKDTTLSQEGQDYTAYVLGNNSHSAGLLVEQLCEPECRVWRIHVLNDDYKASSGIGIGSKYGELQQHYTIDYVSMGDAGLVAVAKDAGLSFILDTGSLKSIPVRNLQPANVPANTLVKGLLVY